MAYTSRQLAVSWFQFHLLFEILQKMSFKFVKNKKPPLGNKSPVPDLLCEMQLKTSYHGGVCTWYRIHNVRWFPYWLVLPYRSLLGQWFVMAPEKIVQQSKKMMTKSRQEGRSDLNLVFCDWSRHSHGSLILRKFDLRINPSMKTPWLEYSQFYAPSYRLRTSFISWYVTGYSEILKSTP